MKYISFVVPSYNSEKYLHKCVESLLLGGDDVEIIIVNDGSKDRTLEIANGYQKKYPTIVRVIDKENGGHGSGINAGLKVSRGLYFKCVDSDDWVDEEAYRKVLETIKLHYKQKRSPDLYYTNFVFERVEDNERYYSSIKKRFPLGKFFSWKDIQKFGIAEYMIMHMMIYKTAVLKECNFHLIEKTFYVDNLFVYQPLKYVQTMFYIDVDFYRYYVGRSNQSVTLENMSKNYLHQLRVMREMSLTYTYEEIKQLEKAQRNYIMHDLVIKSFLTLFFITINGNKEKDLAYKEYFKEFKEKNRKLYYKVRYRSIFIFPFLLIRPLRDVAVKYGYRKIQQKTGWN